MDNWRKSTKHFRKKKRFGILDIQFAEDCTQNPEDETDHRKRNYLHASKNGSSLT